MAFLFLAANTVVVSYPNISVVGAGASDVFTVIMLDLSVSLQPGAANTTLLHWLVDGFVPSQSDGHSLVAAGNKTAAPYFPPGPPAGQTHTYELLLYRQPKSFALPASYQSFFANITAAVTNRIGFNLTEFTEAAKLGSPLAANWFMVSSPADGSSST